MSSLLVLPSGQILCIRQWCARCSTAARRSRRDSPAARGGHTPRDAPGSDACSRSGLPLLAICPNRHRRLIPFRLLRTNKDDRTPLYDRPFKCKECGSPKVTLFAIESQGELTAIQRGLSPSKGSADAPTTHPRADADPPLVSPGHRAESLLLGFAFGIAQPVGFFVLAPTGGRFIASRRATARRAGMCDHGCRRAPLPLRVLPRRSRGCNA